MTCDNTPAFNFVSALCKEGVKKDTDIIILEGRVTVHFMILKDSHSDIGIKTIESEDPGSGYGTLALEHFKFSCPAYICLLRLRLVATERC